MNFKMFFLVGVFTLFLLGCDRNSDGGSTEFVVNQPEGNPVVGLPGPSPFVPSASPAMITVDPLDLDVTGGTVHTFLVTISNVTGTGAVVASNIIGAASGTVTGLPVSISFSALTQVGTDDYTAIGTFSGPLCGPGTAGTTLVYSEDNNSLSRTIFFTVSSGGTCGGGSGGGGAGGGGAGGGGAGGGSTETISYHDDTAEGGLACTTSTGGGYLVHFEAVTLTPPFDITSISYTIDSSGSTGTPLMDVVAFTVSSDTPGTEIGRVVGVGTPTAGSFTVTIPPGAITITTTEFFAGLEASPVETTGIFVGRDETLPPAGPGVGASWIYAPSCGLAFPGIDITDIGDPTLDGNWIITVTISN